MATAYTEFDCLGSDLLSTIQTAILASTDWARPNSGSFPTLYKATTTRGAQMVVELNAVALSVTAFTIDFYHSHNGTTGTSAARRYMRIKGASAGTLAANTYHGIVSAGKEHLFISVEGPRASETSPDSAAFGSVRNYLFMSDLVPYFPGVDTTPTIIHNAAPTNVASMTLNSQGQVSYAARDGLNTLYHSPGRLLTLNVSDGNYGELTGFKNQATLDSNNFYVAPYVFFDYSQGIRGRLSSFFFAGYNQYQQTTTDPIPVAPVGQVIEYNGIDYKLLAVNKSDSSNYSAFGGFGPLIGTSTAAALLSPVVAVPYA